MVDQFSVSSVAEAWVEMVWPGEVALDWEPMVGIP